MAAMTGTEPETLTEVDSQISSLTVRLRLYRAEHVAALRALADRANNAANICEDAAVDAEDRTGDGLFVATSRVVSAAGLVTETQTRIATLHGVLRREREERRTG